MQLWNRAVTGESKLTLAISIGHVRHAGILHHSGRSYTGHHARIARKGSTRLGAHGKLLGIIHHLVGRRSRLHGRILGARVWGAAIVLW